MDVDIERMNAKYRERLREQEENERRSCSAPAAGWVSDCYEGFKSHHPNLISKYPNIETFITSDDDYTLAYRRGWIDAIEKPNRGIN